MPVWLKNIPDNYTAQLAIMGWFLTLTSKMTGYTIPGVGDAPGGTIEQPRDAIAHYLMDMETLADAMMVKKNWDSPQYVILFIAVGEEGVTEQEHEVCAMPILLLTKLALPVKTLSDLQPPGKASLLPDQV